MYNLTIQHLTGEVKRFKKINRELREALRYLLEEIDQLKRTDGIEIDIIPVEDALDKAKKGRGGK